MERPIPKNIAAIGRGGTNFCCPACDGPTGVVDSRGSAQTVRRRRVCRTCGYRVTTWEMSIGNQADFLELLTNLEALNAKAWSAAQDVRIELGRIVGITRSMRELDESRYGNAKAQAAE